MEASGVGDHFLSLRVAVPSPAKVKRRRGNRFTLGGRGGTATRRLSFSLFPQTLRMIQKHYCEEKLDAGHSYGWKGLMKETCLTGLH